MTIFSSALPTRANTPSGSGISTNEVFRPERVAHDIAPLMTSAGCCQYFYSPYKGDKFLRQKLVSFLSTKGVKASTGEIQILSETNQAVDFIVTLLVQPGDTVVMEEPVHPDMSRAMELAGAKILTVPVDQDGMRVDLLEKLILHKHPRFIFVNSSFHDPTGHILLAGAAEEDHRDLQHLPCSHRGGGRRERARLRGREAAAHQGVRHAGKRHLHLFLLADLCHGPEHRGRRGERPTSSAA